MRFVWAIAAVVPVLTGCLGQEPSASEATVSDVELTARADAWRACVSSAYSTNRSSVEDRNVAAEMAFVACQTEEESLVSYALQDPGADAQFLSEAMTDAKARMTAELVAL